MTPELIILTLAALLHAAQFVLFATLANIELPKGATLSPRDRDQLGAPLESMLSVKTARLRRAYNNHTEWLLLFAIAVLIVTMGDQQTIVTAACSVVYLIARVLYVPAYYFGLSPWRSLLWLVGFLATVTMLIAALI